MHLSTKVSQVENEALVKLTPDYKAQIEHMKAKHSTTLSLAKRMVIAKYLTLLANKGELRDLETAARVEQSGELFT